MSGRSERVVSATRDARQSKSRQQDKETAHVMCIVASGSEDPSLRRKNALYEGHGFSGAVKSDCNEGFSP
jgi:hypothetical protein